MDIITYRYNLRTKFFRRKLPTISQNRLKSPEKSFFSTRRACQSAFIDESKKIAKGKYRRTCSAAGLAGFNLRIQKKFPLVNTFAKGKGKSFVERWMAPHGNGVWRVLIHF